MKSLFSQFPAVVLTGARQGEKGNKNQEILGVKGYETQISALR
jgi:hypothetical protein